MKNLILTITVVFSVIMTNAQSISPEVIASAGNSDNIQLNWTIGEVVIDTYDNGSNIITQGFHQTLLVQPPDPVGINNLTGIDVKVYPNPTSEYVIISLNGNDQKLMAELYEISGKLILREPISKEQQQQLVDMRTLASSYYVLKLFSEHQELLSTFKIQKTLN